MILALAGCGDLPDVSGECSELATIAEGGETFDLMLNLEQSDDGQLTGSESIHGKFNNGAAAGPFRVESGSVAESGHVSFRGAISDP